FPYRLGRPPPGQEGRAPGQGDGRQRLAHGLVEGVDGALERKLALGGDPRGHQGLVDQRPAGPAQQRAVEVEERSRAHAVHGTTGAERQRAGTPAETLVIERPAAGAGAPSGTAMSAAAKSRGQSQKKREG